MFSDYHPEPAPVSGFSKLKLPPRKSNILIAGINKSRLALIKIGKVPTVKLHDTPCVSELEHGESRCHCVTQALTLSHLSVDLFLRRSLIQVRNQD